VFDMEAGGTQRERPLTLAEADRVDLDRERSERSGATEDREVGLSALAGALLGIPIGVAVVSAFVATILAVHGWLTWGAMWGGAIGGAYFGGAIGIATARPPKETEPVASPEAPGEFRHAA